MLRCLQLTLSPVPGIAGSRCVDRIKNLWLCACFVYFTSLNNHTNCHREQKEISTTLQSVAACGSCQIYPTLDRPQGWHKTHYPLISTRTKCRLMQQEGTKEPGRRPHEILFQKEADIGSTSATHYGLESISSPAITVSQE